MRGLQCARHLLAARGDANFEGESMGVSALLCPVLSGRLCRNVVFVRANVKVVGRKINDLQGSTFLFSVICDRACMRALLCAEPLCWRVLLSSSQAFAPLREVLNTHSASRYAPWHARASSCASSL